MRLLWLLAACAMTASAATPSFEVASVKQNKSGGMGPSARGGSINFSGAEVTLQNVTLWKIIGVAYGFGEDRDYALTGPEWLKSERYDIVAKVPPDMPKDRMKAYEQLQLMMQSLLTDRFKLVVHHESKVMSAYALVVGKNPPKLNDAEPGSHRMSVGPASMKGQTPMSHFADLLSQKLDRPVVDLTDLKGVYEINLEWSPDEQMAEPGVNTTVTDNAAKPSIFTAIQEQIGLKLEARKLPVDVLAVDHAEKVPSEN